MASEMRSAASSTTLFIFPAAEYARTSTTHVLSIVQLDKRGMIALSLRRNGWPISS